MIVSNLKSKQVYEVLESKEPLQKGDLIWISERDERICAFSTFGEGEKKVIRNDLIDSDMDFEVKENEEYYVFGSSIIPNNIETKEEKLTPDEILDYLIDNNMHEEATVMVFFNNDEYYFSNVEGNVFSEDDEVIFEHHLSGQSDDVRYAPLDENARKLVGKYVVGFSIESNQGENFLLLPYEKEESEEDIVACAYGMLLLDYIEYANINTVSKLKMKISKGKQIAKIQGAEICMEQ